MVGATVSFFNVFILSFFIAINLVYLSLLILSFLNIQRYRRTTENEQWRRIIRSPLTVPVSILAPAYNEQHSIVESVHSLLALEYANYEVIVINDGSRDDTLATLIEHFGLSAIPVQIDYAIACNSIRSVYRSPGYPRLVVLDKVNGGKADALNAGINISANPLFCAIDADSVIEGNALLRVVRPFLERPDETVAVGGMIRVANGCVINRGQVKSIGLPASNLARFQSVEYLRAFLFGRSGWSQLGALLIISGAFGLFKRQIVVDVGGYRADTVGEDIELVFRIHRHLRDRGIPYRVEFLCDPVCWTEVPEDMRTLGRQRNRWQRGLMDSLRFHKEMLFNRRYGVIGMIGMPYFVIFELIGPVIEITGLIVVPLSFAFGFVNLPFFVLFLTLAILLGTMLSIASVILDDLSFQRFPRLSQVLRLVLYGLVENFGYRQLTLWWRVRGVIDYGRGKKSWGDMQRKGFGRPAP
ncbi:MAG: glycosyltransferase family 2 protein [Chloroflexia bacterium]|nr:glycosyltransferase family 2 protein [Chloroflexia bacterium]